VSLRLTLLLKRSRTCRCRLWPPNSSEDLDSHYAPPNFPEVNRDEVRRIIEGGVSGLTYSSALVALSAFLVGSSRPRDLSHPYVGHLAWLRIDSFGIVSFVVATVGLAICGYLRRSDWVTRQSAPARRGSGTISLATAAVARSLVAAGTTLVVYISINAVTHPITLGRPATHLFAWPTEGTLRVIGLIVVAFAVAIDRALRQPEMRKCDSGRMPQP
jgi:hypothetical protein